jgi:general secretion pathway protein J
MRAIPSATPPTGPAAALPPASPRGRAEAGLTLLELLVALALLALLFGLLQQGFTLGHRVWERASIRAAAALDEVEAVQALLRERLAGINAAWTLGNDGQVSLEGDSGRLAFDARPPEVMGPSTFFRYALTANAAGELELAWRPDTDRRPNAPWTRTAILSGIAGLEIAYFGQARADTAARWRDGWRGQPRPPRLVRLRILFPPGDPRIWPDLVVEPRPVVDAACEWDSNRRDCRGRS